MRDGTEFKGDLSAWRAAGIGGDMVQPAVLKRFADAFGPFGCRETAFCLTLWYAVLTVVVAVLAIALHDLERPASLLVAANASLLFALVLGALGGILPAFGAARKAILVALREG